MIENNASLSNLGEIIDADLVAGSLEIRERFSRAINKSGAEPPFLTASWCEVFGDIKLDYN